MPLPLLSLFPSLSFSFCLLFCLPPACFVIRTFTISRPVCGRSRLVLESLLANSRRVYPTTKIDVRRNDVESTAGPCWVRGRSIGLVEEDRSINRPTRTRTTDNSTMRGALCISGGEVQGRDSYAKREIENVERCARFAKFRYRSVDESPDVCK